MKATVCELCGIEVIGTKIPTCWDCRIERVRIARDPATPIHINRELHLSYLEDYETGGNWGTQYWRKTHKLPPNTMPHTYKRLAKYDDVRNLCDKNISDENISKILGIASVPYIRKKLGILSLSEKGLLKHPKHCAGCRHIGTLCCRDCIERNPTNYEYLIIEKEMKQ